MSDFESEIEHELHRVLDPALPGTIPAWRVPRPWSLTKRILGGAGVALGFKVLTGVALAAAAATIAGAATETVITGSVNPSVWGQQVQKSVEACKRTVAASGQHGIGECVSDFASKHGESASDSSQSPEAAETKSPDAKKPTHPAAPGHSDGSKPRAGAPSPQGAEHRPTPTAPRP
jgi:hypothetical protein